MKWNDVNSEYPDEFERCLVKWEEDNECAILTWNPDEELWEDDDDNVFDQELVSKWITLSDVEKAISKYQPSKSGKNSKQNQSIVNIGQNAKCAKRIL